MAYYPELSRLITSYLNEQQRSASWLATRLGVHPSTVINWQNGDNRPKDPEMVIRLADALNIYASSARRALLEAAGYAYVEPSDPASPPPTEPSPTEPTADVDPTAPPAAGPAVAEQTVLPTEPPPMNPLEDLSPPSPTAPLAIPVGPPAPRKTKSAWLCTGAGLLGFGLLLGLSYPLLWEWPVARQGVAGIVLLVLVAGAAVGWRRRGLGVQRWPKLVGQSPLAAGGAVGLLVVSVGLWLWIGLPRLLGQWPYRGRDEDGDRFGYALANADFNSDGLPDLAVGAPGKAATRFNPQSRTGWVYTFTGVQHGLLPGPNFGQAGLAYNQNGDRFGWSMVTGDFNGDNLPDLAVGAPGKTIGDALHSGYVYIFKGTTHGLTPWQSIDQHLLGHNETADQFGWSLAAGDFNHDGVDDLAIGAPYEAPGANPRSGFVFIFTGGAQGFTQWFGVERQAFTPEQDGDLFGWALAAGDFDHNGTTDLAVGAPGVISDTAPSHAPTGHVYIFHNAPGEPPQPWLDLSPPLTGTQALGSRFGAALVAADFDADGRVDLAVGAPDALPETKPAHPVPGAVYLFHNRLAGLAGWQTLSAPNGEENQPGNLFGWALAVGDFNRDALLDLAVGAPGLSLDRVDGKRRNGGLFTFKNQRRTQTAAILVAWQKFTEPNMDRAQFNDRYGWSLTSGDLDHDGADELAVGAPGGELGAHWVAGNVFTYRSAPNGLSPALQLFQDMSP